MQLRVGFGGREDCAGELLGAGSAHFGVRAGINSRRRAWFEKSGQQRALVRGGGRSRCAVPSSGSGSTVDLGGDQARPVELWFVLAELRFEIQIQEGMEDVVGQEHQQ